MDTAQNQPELTSLLNNLPGMVYRCQNDANWTMTFISSGCEELTGFKPSELQHNQTASYADIIHPDDQDLVNFEIEKAITLQSHWTIQYRIISKNQTTKWVWEQGIGIYDGDTLLHLEGFITDITQTKQLEEELKHGLKQKKSQLSLEHLALQYQASVDQFCYVLKIDNDGYIQYANPLFLETFGVNERDLLNTSLANTPFMKAEQDNKALWKQITETPQWHGTLTNKDAQGKVHSLTTCIRAIKNHRGQTKAYLFIQHPI